MPTLLSRELTSAERVLQGSIRKILPTVPQMPFSEALCRKLGLDGPEMYFAAILSLISLPPRSTLEFTLCRYLLAIPRFYLYLASPDHFEHRALLAAFRLMMRIDVRFDVKIITALADDPAVEREVFLRVLSVLDEMSPGGRLTMTLARVLRDSEPAVASKVAMLMARRIVNPVWVERQLTSPDARTRANVIETLWGVDTDRARECLMRALDDENNRVVGNALLGLHLLNDDAARPGIRDMAGHAEPAFRATAAWLMGKTGDRSYIGLLTEAMGDADTGVRTAAERALAAMPPEPEPEPEPAVVEVVEEAPKWPFPNRANKLNVGVQLDGTYHRAILRR